jgi:hypothetical protein
MDVVGGIIRFVRGYRAQFLRLILFPGLRPRSKGFRHGHLAVQYVVPLAPNPEKFPGLC